MCLPQFYSSQHTFGARFEILDVLVLAAQRLSSDAGAAAGAQEHGAATAAAGGTRKPAAAGGQAGAVIGQVGTVTRRWGVPRRRAPAARANAFADVAAWFAFPLLRPLRMRGATGPVEMFGRVNSGCRGRGAVMFDGAHAAGLCAPGAAAAGAGRGHGVRAGVRVHAVHGSAGAAARCWGRGCPPVIGGETHVTLSLTLTPAGHGARDGDALP